MSYNKKIFSIILAVLAVFGAEAAVVVELTATFEADETKGELAGNKVAELDGVKVVSDGTWAGDNLTVQVGQTLTVEAQEFENIYKVTITAKVDDLSASRLCHVTYAKGPDGEGVANLGESATAIGSTTSIEDMLKWTFEFPADIELSDVSFEFATDVYVNRVAACLDVLPELPDGETNLVGDDKLLIAKRSNAVDYIYTVTNDTDEIHSSVNGFGLDDYTEIFKPLPEEGVSLAGHPEGKYALYVAAVPNANNVSVASNTNHVIVNYSTKSPSTFIDEVAVSKAEYYDLQGRRVVKPTNGLCIVRDGTTSRVQLIKR